MLHFRQKIVFNLDDFSEEIMTADLWKLLFDLKKQFPKLKATMFTIPLQCSKDWLRMVKTKYQWIEMHYHGSDHKNRDEWFNCSNINLPHQEFFYRGFKAPWWRMDQQTADIFNKAGFLLSLRKGYFDIRADKSYYYNLGKEVIPQVIYKNRLYKSIHSHVQHQKHKDGLPDIYDEIVRQMNVKNEFVFISDMFTASGNS